MNKERLSLKEISIRGLCVDLFKNIWMILLAAAATWCVATAWHNLTFQPMYTSSATLVVGVKGQTNAYSSLGMASQMTDVYNQVFQSEALEKKIRESVGEEIQGSITGSMIEETNLLVLRATSPKPRQAYLFLYSALENYEEVAGQIFANADLKIVQEPDIPYAPSNTSWMLKNRYLLMMLAACGMAGLIVLYYVMRFTVKNEKNAEMQLDGKILGVIPYEKKGRKLRGKKGKKKALILTDPTVSMGYAEAGRKIETRIEYRMRQNKQKVLLVTSIGENEGKSTVAANLALSMAEKHKKVLLVDGDLRKPAQYKIFEVRKKDRISLDKVLKRKSDWRAAVYPGNVRGLQELFQFYEVKKPEQSLKEERIRELLQEWRQEMDYIIVDCSPVMVSADAELWMRASDTVALVVREDWADIRLINDTVDLVHQIEVDFAGFVLNAFHREWIGKEDTGRYGDYRTQRATVREER